MKIPLCGLFKAGLEKASQQWRNTPNEGHVPASEQLKNAERTTEHPAVFLPVVTAADLVLGASVTVWLNKPISHFNQFGWF